MEFVDNFAKLALRHKHVSIASGALVVVSAGGIFAIRRSLHPAHRVDLPNISYEESIALFQPGGRGRRLKPLAEAAVRIASAEDGITRHDLSRAVSTSKADFEAVTDDLRGWGLAVGGWRFSKANDGLGQKTYSYMPTHHLMKAIDPAETQEHSQLKVLHKAAGRVGIDLTMVHDAYVAVQDMNRTSEPE
jgi:hypothetical protein